MKLLRFSLFVMLVAMLTACASNEDFEIHGTVVDNGTLNLRIVYFGDDNINNVLTASRDGVFDFKGNAPKGQMVEILDNDYRVLVRLYAVNGDKLKVNINPTNPRASVATGSAVNDEWTKWISDNINTLNTRNSRTINDAVERFVKSHPDDVLSTLLMLTEYDTNVDVIKAQKLMASINVDARPTYLVESWVANLARAGQSAQKVKVAPITYISATDTVLTTYNPKRQDYSLLVFTNENSGRHDSIVPKLREIAKKYPNRRRLAIVDFSLDNDTFTWKREYRADSITWTSGWGGGSVAAAGIERLNITSLPYFIVTDSTGTQIYRGPSITAANTALTTKLR